MRYDFDEIIERRGTASTKWDKGPDGAKLADNCIPMWIADMDFACPPAVVDALHKAVDRRIYGYSRFPDGYYEAVCAFYERRHHFRIKEEDILFTQGVVPMLALAVRTLTEPGDGILIQTPVYYPFFSAITDNKRVVVENPLINENGVFSIDFDDLEKKASLPGTKAMILCSPHNPVGRVWTTQELARIEDICLKHGLLLISDEIHGDLIRGGFRHRSVMELFYDQPNIICCTAPTKTFNIAGLGASHAFCRNTQNNKKLRDAIGHSSPNPLTAAAVIAAVTACDDWLDQMNAYTDGSCELFYALCADAFPKATVSRIEGTYLAWMDISPYILDAEEAEKRALRDCGVYVEAGNPFGAAGRGHLRINLACPRSYIREAVSRCARLVTK